MGHDCKVLKLDIGAEKVMKSPKNFSVSWKIAQRSKG